MEWEEEIKLSPRRLWFNPRALLVGLVVGKVALWQGLFWVRWLSLSFTRKLLLTTLTLILLMWRIGWAPNNASKWQMEFNLAFKGLREHCKQRVITPNTYSFWPGETVSFKMHFSWWIIKAKICTVVAVNTYCFMLQHRFAVTYGRMKFVVAWHNNEWHRHLQLQILFSGHLSTV